MRPVEQYIHLVTLIRGHLAVLGVKWPFPEGVAEGKSAVTPWVSFDSNQA